MALGILKNIPIYHILFLLSGTIQQLQTLKHHFFVLPAENPELQDVQSHVGLGFRVLGLGFRLDLDSWISGLTVLAVTYNMQDIQKSGKQKSRNLGIHLEMQKSRTGAGISGLGFGACL